MALMKPLLSLVLALTVTNPAEAQCDYSFCGGTVTNPTATVTSKSGVQGQCSVVQLGIDLGLVNAEECARLPDQEQICCPAGGSTGGGDSGGTTTQSCFVCGTDKTFNKEKSWSGQKVCAAADASLSAIPAGSLCDSTKEAANAVLDMPSFCECEGAVAPSTCKFCDDNQEVSTTAMVPEGNGLTCSANADYLKSLVDSTLCASLATDAVKAACCIDKASSAISLSTSNLAIALLVGLAFAF